ncbi:MAG: HAMP domain-containing protein [Armatimonadetes bacterium]|nr:HAMP domain-containing protein [Armatimonadota bacterium]
MRGLSRWQEARHSIRMKMMLQIMPVVAFVFCITMIVTIINVTGAQKSLAYEGSVESARSHANELDSRIRAWQSAAQTLADTMSQYRSGDRQEVNRILEKILDKRPDIVGVYVGYEPNAFDRKDKEFTRAEGHDKTGRYIPYWNRLKGEKKLESLLDIDISDYYALPKNSKADSVVDPFLYDGVLLTSYVSPILRNGKFIGIGGVNVSLEHLDKIVGDIRLFQTGYAFLVSNSGAFVSYKDKSLIGKQKLAAYGEKIGDERLVSMAKSIRSGKEGYIRTLDPATREPVVMFYSPVPTGNWGLVTVVPEKEMLASVGTLQKVLVFLTLASLPLMAGIISMSALRLVKPIIALESAAGRIAAGDLDVTVDYAGLDEIGRMSSAFGRMVAYLQGMASAAGRMAEGDLTLEVAPHSEKDVLGHAFARMVVFLKEAVGRVAESAVSLQAAAEDLASSARQAGQATSQVAGAIQQVAAGSAQQAEMVSRAANSVEQMARAIDGVAQGAQEQAGAVHRSSGITAEITGAIRQVAENAQTGAEGAAEASRAARDGVNTVAVTIRGMETIKEAVGLSAQKVQGMGDRSQKIGAIVETIDEIASQTNLLALNAAIEAARAGEYGRGFAVVADEVRKLAERSSAATREIADLIGGVQQTVTEAVSAMAQGAREVETGTERAHEAGQSLENIVKTADNVLSQANEIASAAQEMNASSRQLMAAIEAVSAVVEENTAATEEMAAGAGEVTQSIESIASVSEESSAAAQEVSATTEEMSAQVQEVAAGAQVLNEMADRLQEVVNRFRLETASRGEPLKRAA